LSQVFGSATLGLRRAARPPAKEHDVPVSITVSGRTYDSDKKYHAEELMVGSGRHRGDIEAEMNAWPCTGERGHNCHDLLLRQSAGRTIVVTVTDDHGGYAANHGLKMGTTGKVTYKDGKATYG
jgi:hypothetical protein